MKLVRAILANRAAMGALVSTLANGATVIDMAQQAPGSWVAARYYSLITMGGLGEFSYETFPYPLNGVRLPAVRVMTAHGQLDGEQLEEVMHGFVRGDYQVLLATAIIEAAGLSFLGLGLRPPLTSWGVLLTEAQNINVVALYPWLLAPVAPVIITVLAFNFLGDGLRDAADPYR